MMEYQYNSTLVFINLFLWLFLIMVYRKDFWAYRIKRNQNYWLLYCCVSLFTTFAFSEPDTYHYHEIYDRMLKINSSIHVEDFYYILLKFLPENYYLWRFFIWGIATLILIIAFNRFHLNPGVVSFLLPVILLQQLSITRGCLGISIFLLSISFLLKPIKGRRIISVLISIIGCIVSLYFHRSMPIFIFLFFFSYIPLNRFSILTLIILFPFIRLLLVPQMVQLLNLGIFNEDTIMFSMKYIQGEQSIANVMGLARQAFEYLPRFLIIYFIVKYIIFNKDGKPSYIIQLAQYTFLLFYISLLLYGQEVSSFMASRTIHMMCFPLLIVSAYASTMDIKKTLLRCSIVLFIIYDLFSFIHSIYKW